MHLHHYPDGVSKYATLNRLLHTDRLVPALLVLFALGAPFVLCPERAGAAPGVPVAEVQAEPGRIRDRGGEGCTGRASALGFRIAGEPHFTMRTERVAVGRGSPPGAHRPRLADRRGTDRDSVRSRTPAASARSRSRRSAGGR